MPHDRVVRVLASLTILAFGFVLQLFAANPDASLAQWVQRHRAGLRRYDAGPARHDETRHTSDEETALAPVLHRFGRWHAISTVRQVVTCFCAVPSRLTLARPYSKIRNV
jgi:hypothetical protein